MTAPSDPTYTLWRVNRPHIDTTGARPGNTATWFMRSAFRHLKTGDDVMIQTGVHDGDPNEMEFFYLVPRRLMKRILTDAGIDPNNIPTWCSNRDPSP